MNDTYVQVAKVRKVPRKFTSTEITRRSILRATLKLIGKGGPDAVTHRAVAGRAKIPLGSVAYHFQSRDRLIIEAFRALMNATELHLASVAQEKQLTNRGVTPQDLINGAALMLEQEFTHPEFVRAEYELILYTAHSPELKREFLAYQRSIQTGFAYLLELLGAPRPFDAARTVMGMVRAFELERLVEPTAKIEEFMRRLDPIVRALVEPAPSSGQSSTSSAEKKVTH